MRLWVEMWITGRLWRDQYRQPPCEAVSWNRDPLMQDAFDSPSASLWGCELKCVLCKTDLLFTVVSLLVRLWVEISVASWRYAVHHRSASLWGCELKCSTILCHRFNIRQPPCEAVSWNCTPYLQLMPVEYGQPPCEAVSWNSPPENP